MGALVNNERSTAAVFLAGPQRSRLAGLNAMGA